MQEDRLVRVNGPALRTVREARRQSVSELARQVGVTRPCLSMVERGVRFSLRGSVLDAVASALGVDPALLMAQPEALVASPAA